MCLSNRTPSPQQSWQCEVLMVKTVSGDLSCTSHSQDSAALELVSGLRSPLDISCLRASHLALYNPRVQNVQKIVKPSLQVWKCESCPSLCLKSSSVKPVSFPGGEAEGDAQALPWTLLRQWHTESVPAAFSFLLGGS